MIRPLITALISLSVTIYFIVICVSGLSREFVEDSWMRKNDQTVTTYAQSRQMLPVSKTAPTYVLKTKRMPDPPITGASQRQCAQR